MQIGSIYKACGVGRRNRDTADKHNDGSSKSSEDAGKYKRGHTAN